MTFDLEITIVHDNQHRTLLIRENLRDISDLRFTLVKAAESLRNGRLAESVEELLAE